MAHSYISALFHCTFSTKGHRRWIEPEIQTRLWPYMGGIARQNKMTALAIGGVEDHAHILLSLPRTITISKAMQLIKGGSSKWLHEQYPNLRAFEWQEGYGAFTIGISQRGHTEQYIGNQREHHRKQTFQEEFISFLEAHGIEYDPLTIWN